MMALPNSIAPSALGEEQDKGKRKRRLTKRYNEAVEEGILDPSQHRAKPKGKANNNNNTTTTTTTTSIATRRFYRLYEIVRRNLLCSATQNFSEVAPS